MGPFSLIGFYPENPANPENPDSDNKYNGLSTTN
jgi:hypothetical protein